MPRVAADSGWLHQTLLGYTLSRRCLPIALIAAALVVAAAACRRAFAMPRAAGCSPRARCSSTELCAVSAREAPQAPLFSDVLSTAQFSDVPSTAQFSDGPSAGPSAAPGYGGPPSSAPDRDGAPGRAAVEGGEPIDEPGARCHTVRIGRPDFGALIRSATAELATPPPGTTPRLVVAACGPPALVEAAREAVAAARTECRAVRIEFSGGDARW